MLLANDVRKAKRVFLCGNGGSAANAMHIANDLISCGIPAQVLSADVATLTAIANDFDYQYIFSRQLSVFAQPGDLLIALSGSGASPNIIQAIKMAKTIGMTAILVTGKYHEDTEASLEATRCIKTGNDMQEAEEKQLWIGHELMRELKKMK